MENFRYYNPVRIIFGTGERRQLTEEIKKNNFKRVLLVVSKGPFRENGLVGEIEGFIKQAGAEVFEMGDIDSNPRISSIREGAAVCKKNRIDCIVALGGGSTMDAVKVIASTALSDFDPWDHLWGKKKPCTNSIYKIMIPTLAATGTDVNPWAVIMDEEAKSKMPVTSECMFPNVTISDPEIHASVPLKLTIWGVMDILSHTFEFYFNGYHKSIFQNRFSEAIILSVMECINILSKNPKDVEARGELWWSSIMAWGGLTFVGRDAPDMSCHDIAEGFVPFYDTHHGATLGVITPRWMRHVALKNEKSREIFARFARKVFGITDDRAEMAAEAGVTAYLDWLRSVGAPSTLKELTGKDITDDKVAEIADKTMYDIGRPVGRLVPLSREDIIHILKSCRAPM